MEHSVVATGPTCYECVNRSASNHAPRTSLEPSAQEAPRDAANREVHLKSPLLRPGGAARIAALALLAIPWCGASAALAQDTRIRIDSEPGAVPSNQHLDLVPTASALKVYSGRSSGAELYLSGLAVPWGFKFGPPDRIPFGPGTYAPAATSYPMAEMPSIQLYYNNGYTSTPTGGFEVRKATWDASNKLASLWVVFRFTGSNRFGPGVNGEIRWNADTSLYIRCPRVALAFTSDSVSIPISAVDTRGRAVTLSASSLPAGAELLPTGNGAALLRWPATPASEGRYPIRITATNDQGLQDTSMTFIRVAHRFQMSLRGPAADPVTQGITTVLQRPDVTLYRISSPTYFAMDIHSWYRQWDWDFRPPAYQGLTEGTYEALQVDGVQSSEETGIYLANGRMCSTLDSGTLRLRRYRLAADGSLASLWAELEQTCAGAAGGLIGELRFNCDTALDVQAPVMKLVTRDQPVRFDVTSLVAGGGPARLSALALPAGATFVDRGDGTGSFEWVPGPAIGSTASATFAATAPSGASDTVTSRIQARVPFRVRLWNSPASYMMLYRPWLYEAPTSPIVLTESPDSSLTVAVQGQGQSWAFTFSAPAGRRLTTGLYDDTDPDHLHLTPRARFRCGRNNWAIGYDTRFHVRRLVRSPNGAVRSFWATFQVSPEPGAPPDSGEIRYDADTTLYVLAPGEVALPAGSGFHFDVRAYESEGRPVQFALLSAPVGGSLSDHGDGTLSFDVPAGVVPPGRWPVVLRATSESGVSDTTTVMLRAMVPATLVAVSDSTDPVARGVDESRDVHDACFAFERTQFGGVRATVATRENVWSLAFGAPNALSLVAGEYLHPRTCPSCAYAIPEPRMDLLQDGRYCSNGIDGSFDVRRVRYAPDGAVRSLWVKFDQTCKFAGGLRGELRYDADTSVYLRVPRYVATEIGRATTVPISAVDTRGLAVAFSVPVLPPGSSLVDHGDGTAALEWPGGPDATGTYAVTWIATSSDGKADTSSTTIEAFRTALFTLQGGAGDPVSQGGSLRLTGSDGLVTSSMFSDSTVNLAFSGSGHALEFDFAAPFKRSLREGQFTRARRYQTQQLDEPGLLVKVDGRLCDLDSAIFHVRRLKRDASGALASYWATFTQRCKGGTALLTGEIRIAADTVLYIEAPAEVARIVGEPVTFDVRAVDTRGLGVSLAAAELPDGATFTPGAPATGVFAHGGTDTAGAVRRVVFVATSDDGRADTVVTLVRTFAPDLVRVTNDPAPGGAGAGVTEMTAIRGALTWRRLDGGLEVLWRGLRDSWVLQLAVPYGRPLAVARYDSVQPMGVRAASQPGTSLLPYYDTGATPGGRFHVRRLVPNADGTIRSLWLVWELHNLTGTSPSHVGEIYLGSPDTTWYLDGPADQFCDPSQPVAYAIAARGALAGDVRWTLLDAPAGTTLTPEAGGSASVRWPGGPSPGNFPVRVLAEGASGTDSLTTWVHVAGPSYVEIHVDPVYFIPLGLHRRFLDRDASFAYWRNAGNNAVSVAMSAPRNGGRWDFSRAYGAKIVPGSYTVTGSIPPVGSSPNGIYFVWNSLVPGVKSGRFDVWEATYSPTDSLLSFVATFEMILLNTSVPFRGEIHLAGSDLPTPALVTLVESTWTGTAVRVRWLAPGARGAPARVERSRDGGWEWLSDATADGSDMIVIEDRDVAPGNRYGYRLSLGAEGPAIANEAWVDVPAAALLDLQRIGSNPGRAPLQFALATPARGPATLELLDVAGRVIDQRQWSDLPAGRQVVTLDGIHALAPGCYFARLEAGGRVLTRSVVVLR